MKPYNPHLPAHMRVPAVQSKSYGRMLFYVLLYLFACFTGGEFEAVLLTLPVLVFVSTWSFFIQSPRFTSDDMYCFCLLLFFAIVPCQNLKNGVLNSIGAAANIVYASSELWHALLIVILFIGMTFLGRGLFLRRRVDQAEYPSVLRFLTPNEAVILSAMSVVCVVGFAVFYGGFRNVVAARALKVGSSLDFIAFGFLAMNFMGNIIMAASISGTIRTRGLGAVSSFAWIALLVGFAALGFCVNPFNMSRFVLVGCWLPIGLALLGGWARYWVVYSLLVFGIIVAMPILSVTTRGGKADVEVFKDSAYAQNVFFIKDVDVLDTLTHTVKYVEGNGYANGRNLTAILLFFVPRSFWPNKPIVGGLVIGEDLFMNFGAGTSNLSYFFAGDLYMDFGFIGVIFGGLLVGWVWRLLTRSDFLFSDTPILQLVLAGSMPILMRGPVGAVAGFFVCSIFAFYIFRWYFSSSFSRAFSNNTGIARANHNRHARV